MLRALIWDVDGTIAETERDGHRVAFNQAFDSLGLPWHWSVSQYGELLRVTGGRERLLHFMSGRADAPPTVATREALALELHARKNRCYIEIVAAGGIAARPGVVRLIDECRAEGVALAVATTTGAGNVAALFSSLIGERWREVFTAVVCAEDAPLKKPHPQVYEVALQRLGLAPEQAFALEDSPAGLQAARSAGIACGVTPGVYFAAAEFDGAAWQQDDLESPTPMTLKALRIKLAQGG